MASYARASQESRIDDIVEQATRRYLAIFANHIEAADGATFYSTDLIMFGLLNRNLALLRAMPSLIKERNIHALAPLLRVQLDGLLRLHAYRIVESMDALARHVMAGNSMRKFKDRDGKPLNDKHLVNHLKEEIPWIEPVYDTLSGWVHFSESHIFSAVRPGEAESSFVAAAGDFEDVPDALFVEATDAIEAIHAATAELMRGYFGRFSGA